jgi:Rho GTPase-activating protein 1
MHDVSLRVSINRMDAHNLAAVLAPNLIKGKNPTRDVILCSVIPGASPFEAQASTQPSPSAKDRGTLGMIVKLFVERYHDIFDGPVEVTSTSPVTTAAITTTTTVDSDFDLTTTSMSTATSMASLSGSTAVESPYLGGKGGEEDEEIDDAMLVMPIGLSNGRNGSASGSVGNVGIGMNGARPRYKVRRFGSKPT